MICDTYNRQVLVPGNKDPRDLLHDSFSVVIIQITTTQDVDLDPPKVVPDLPTVSDLKLELSNSRSSSDVHLEK